MAKLMTTWTPWWQCHWLQRHRDGNVIDYRDTDSLTVNFWMIFSHFKGTILWHCHFKCKSLWKFSPVIVTIKSHDFRYRYFFEDCDGFFQIYHDDFFKYFLRILTFCLFGSMTPRGQFYTTYAMIFGWFAKEYQK